MKPFKEFITEGKNPLQELEDKLFPAYEKYATSSKSEEDFDAFANVAMELIDGMKGNKGPVKNRVQSMMQNKNAKSAEKILLQVQQSFSTGKEKSGAMAG